MNSRWQWVAALAALLWLLGCKPAEHLPVEARIESGGVEPLNVDLSLFANGLDGYVFAAQGATLVRLINGGRTLEPLYRFDDPIAGIHTTPSGLVLVSTTRDHWDSTAPCRVFISRDRAHSFELTKEIDRPGGCALWWSFASSADGTLYLGEYGPRQDGMSKTVWRSRDGGRSWQPVFHAPLNDNAHVHRVAVDPYTGHVWVTVGDGSPNHGVFRSTDGGDTWNKVRASQATGVAFSEQGIYWGEDMSDGEISFTSRNNGATDRVLRVSDRGSYGGSVYDLAIGRSGRVYAPFMKYPNQNHIATLWSGSGPEWKLLLRLASRPGEGVNVPTIAGPDRDGWLYISGYRIRDGS
jgi:hypothetical protein